MVNNILCHKIVALISFFLMCLTVFTGCAVKNGADVDRKDQLTEFFDARIADNPIDKKYEDDLKNGDKLYGEVVNEYVSAWKNELIGVKSDIFSAFSEEVAQELLENIENWEDVLEKEADFEFENVFDGDRNKFGSLYYFERMKNHGDKVRGKTIELKRMIFLKETQLNPDEFSDDLISLRFISIYKSN